MNKILFTNSNCSWNKGSAAQVISTSEIIRKYNKDTKIVLLSRYSEEDSKFCNCHDIDVMGSRMLNNIVIKIFFNLISFALIKIGLARLLSWNSMIKEYLNADLIVDLSGDTLSDVGAFPMDVISGLMLISALDKPFLLYSQSIGPLKDLNCKLAKYALNKADMIFVREGITEQFLNDVGIQSQIELMPDCAFVLMPSSSERVNKILFNEKIPIKTPLIGISANGMVGDENYISVMSAAVDYITRDKGVQVIFIPHVLGRKENYGEDDRLIGRKIFDRLKSKENVYLIEGDYSPNDLKGIIKKCDMFIGGRMHANIGALSTNVPVIATSWSHKYYGIMDSLGLSDYVFDISTIDFEEMKQIIDSLWDDKDQIKNELENKIPKQKELVWQSGKIICEFL